MREIPRPSCLESENPPRVLAEGGVGGAAPGADRPAADAAVVGGFVVVLPPVAAGEAFVETPGRCPGVRGETDDDAVDAGEGDIVLIAQEGWSASTASTGRPGAAIDSAIVGVVDYVDLL